MHWVHSSDFCSLLRGAENEFEPVGGFGILQKIFDGVIFGQIRDLMDAVFGRRWGRFSGLWEQYGTRET
ncbi:hypothetical protein L596_007699 [Steinernema carpocapsae]|uniref:Uncharacterized protein n=1 Tax=Steinernema carpocapsae TaxID=34508 RepID=A0A4U5PA81_STECR|nr:hypothetical protein L596_007699 [Steinernema carpocapsae]